jgi:hypothetical protein
MRGVIRTQLPRNVLPVSAHSVLRNEQEPTNLNVRETIGDTLQNLELADT